MITLGEQSLSNANARTIRLSVPGCMRKECLEGIQICGLVSKSVRIDVYRAGARWITLSETW